MIDNNTVSYGGYRYFELKKIEEEIKNTLQQIKENDFTEEEIKDILQQIKENDFTEEEIEYLKDQLEEYEVDFL